MRFDAAYEGQVCRDPGAALAEGASKRGEHGEYGGLARRQADRVELSCDSLSYEPWSDTIDREKQSALASIDHHVASTDQLGIKHEPREITPVVGSAALAGLGVSLVVPGSLLDVVA